MSSRSQIIPSPLGLIGGGIPFLALAPVGERESIPMRAVVILRLEFQETLTLSWDRVNLRESIVTIW